MDGVAGGLQVFRFQSRAEVVDYLQRGLLAKRLLDGGPGGRVAGVNDGQFVAGAEAGTGVGRGDRLGLGHHVADGAAIGAAGEKYHVRPKVSDPFDALVGASAVVGRQRVDDDGAGAERGARCRFGRHLTDHAGHHHLEAAAGRGGGDVGVGAFVSLSGND